MTKSCRKPPTSLGKHKEAMSGDHNSFILKRMGIVSSNGEDLQNPQNKGYFMQVSMWRFKTMLVFRAFEQVNCEGTFGPASKFTIIHSLGICSRCDAQSEYMENQMIILPSNYLL